MTKHFYCLLLLLLGTHVANAATIKPFADILAWSASETNTTWALAIAAPNGNRYIDVQNIKYNTRPGYRVGLLYAQEDHTLDTSFSWTYFATNQTRTIPTGGKIISSAFFSGSFFLSTDVFFGATSKWQLAMNMFDLNVSHAFEPAPQFTLTPKIGIKGGSINQDVNIEWNAIIYNSVEQLTNNFSGIGPSFGLDARWSPYQNFSFIGDISAALMYGRWHLSDLYQRPSALLGIITKTDISSSINQTQLGTWMMDYYLGLEWQHHGKSNVSFRIGYEMQYWPEQLRLIAFQQLPPAGDLTIQGASCGITIDL